MSEENQQVRFLYSSTFLIQANVYQKVCLLYTSQKRQHVLIDYTTTNQTYGANYRVTSERYM